MREIFVFGSNLAGRHGKGAAKYAYTHHGAIYGVGEGLTGNSYAIPTKDRNIRTRPLSEIRKSVDKFKEYARLNPQMKFIVTPIGTGLAGYTHQDIAPLFRNCPPNCQMPNEWVEILKGDLANEEEGNQEEDKSHQNRCIRGNSSSLDI